MPADFNAIMKQIQEAQDKANAANLERYNQLLASIDTLGQQVGETGTYGRAIALQEQLGTAGRQRITEQAQKTWAAAEQDLTTRGLGSTTIREAVRRGTASDAEMARQRLEETVAQQKSGVLQGLAGAQMQVGGMKAGAIEGRYDTGPDLGMFASLLTAAAAGDKADAAQTRTATMMGPMAMAGRTGTGQPFKYAGGGSAGAGGGGISQQGGGGGAGGRATAQYTPPTGRGWDILPGPTGGGGVGFGGAGGAAAGAATRPTGLVGPTGGPAAVGPEADILAQAKQMAGPEAAGKIGLAGAGGTEEEYITDYNEYKKLAGTSAVSPMYFDAVFGGRVKRSGLQQGGRISGAVASGIAGVTGGR